MQAQAMPGAMQLRGLHAQGDDDSHGLFQVQLSAARPQLLEPCAKRTGGNRSTNGQGRDQVLNARHSGPRIVPKIHGLRARRGSQLRFIVASRAAPAFAPLGISAVCEFP